MVYAKWNSYTYTVTYEDLGADVPVSPKAQTVTSPQTTIASLPGQPRMNSCNFTGWYTDDGIKFTEQTQVTKNITVYAGWRCDPN
jgi:uncharacterized repeat protein (TIGR02543 family)